jgi:hypothetical protein
MCPIRVGARIVHDRCPVPSSRPARCVTTREGGTKGRSPSRLRRVIVRPFACVPCTRRREGRGRTKVNANANGRVSPRRAGARRVHFHVHFHKRSTSRLRRVVSPRACASARVGARTRVRRDNETITLGDNCLCLRLASRVCPVRPEAGGRHRCRRSRSVNGCGVHGLVQRVRATPCTCRRAGGSVALALALALVTVSESAKVPPVRADAREWNFGTLGRSP